VLAAVRRRDEAELAAAAGPFLVEGTGGNARVECKGALAPAAASDVVSEGPARPRKTSTGSAKLPTVMAAMSPRPRFFTRRFAYS
jgi:hypothetical protein